MSSDIGIDDAGCEANPMDARCSCYNVLYKDCDANTTIPGCKEAVEWKNSVIDLIPTNSAFDSQRELASREISLRYHCASNVCSSNKYRPPVYQDVEGLGLCNFQLNICASDVNVGESINSKYFRDCSINQMDFVDLDSVYGQDQGVQALLGLRTGENAALIAAKNKQLQLALRAEEREAEANRQAELDAGVTDELNAIQAVSEEYERQKDTKMKFIIIGILFLLLVVVAILNL